MASHEANKDLDEWSNSTVVVVPLPEVQSMSLCLNSTERQSNVNFTPYPIDANGEGNSLTARSCPRDWDGFLCWPQTLPEQIVLQRCPTLRRPDAIGVTVSQVDKVAEFAWRHCGANGTWTSLQSSDSYSWHLYTNFSACNMDPTVALSPNEQELYRLIRVHLPAIKQMSIVGYSTSLALLLGAFTLLASLKRLRCARNKIHLHLFASFIVRAVVLVHKHSSTRHSDLTPQCWMLMCLFHYSLMANYCWILVEGLYLHNLIFNSFYADGSSIAKYVVMGWGLPVSCVIVWAIARNIVGNDTCWTSDAKLIQWLLRGPITLSIVLNFIFFINITRVVFIKMSNSHEPEARRVKYRKWFKSTLVLVPLFGAHHIILMVMSIAAVTPLYELYWLYIDQLFTSFQVTRLWPRRIRSLLQRRSPRTSQPRTTIQTNGYNERSFSQRLNQSPSSFMPRPQISVRSRIQIGRKGNY
ncbi:secretin receptor-like isoform X2 [Varroa jacobsoni]|uniref:secretin receptor-like isoform X2 n=1 Tax=Varroa jacobsoni TaxID=62625 RepID=UPI000BF824E5|nr:secretin receptor-like isoform X2 [Varroa jacobsoni]